MPKILKRIILVVAIIISFAMLPSFIESVPKLIRAVQIEDSENIGRYSVKVIWYLIVLLLVFLIIRIERKK